MIQTVIRIFFDKTSFLLFVMAMLRLKKLEIYMNRENDTEEKILRQLFFNRVVIYVYVLGWLIYEALHLITGQLLEAKRITLSEEELKQFIIMNLSLTAVGVATFTYVHLYIFCMGMRIVNLISFNQGPNKTLLFFATVIVIDLTILIKILEWPIWLYLMQDHSELCTFEVRLFN